VDLTKNQNTLVANQQ